MVSCKLYGRLGNQLFQISTALAYSWDYMVPFRLPTVTENMDAWPHYFYEHPALKSYFGTADPSFYIQQGHRYIPIPKIDKPHVVLDGFFQSYKFFDDYESRIQNLFNPEWEPLKSVCSVHIRRGDYLMYPTKHPVVTEQYLKKAIDLVMSKRHVSLLIYFSDDIEWTSKFASKIGIRYVISTGKDSLEDVRLMSCCSSNIISNSSFSWWGAYLNKDIYKTVVSPHEDNWFGIDNKHLDVSDLLPETWNTIKY